MNAAEMCEFVWKQWEELEVTFERLEVSYAEATRTTAVFHNVRVKASNNRHSFEDQVISLSEDQEKLDKGILKYMYAVFYLREAIFELNRKEILVISKRYINHLTWKEVAKQTGMTQQGVQLIQHRVMPKLKKIILPELPV